MNNLFKKINIIDLLIIILILVLIPTFFHIYRTLKKKPTPVPYTWVKVEAVTFVTPEFAELLKAGDNSYDDDDGSIDGRLLKIVKIGGDYNKALKSLNPAVYETYRYRTPVLLELELRCIKYPKSETLYRGDVPGYPVSTFIHPSLTNATFFRTNRYAIDCLILKFKD